MKIKKLNYLLLLGLSGGMFLTGCVGNETNSMPVSMRGMSESDQVRVNKYLVQHNIKLSANSDGMIDNDIATSIVHVDANDEPASNYIYTDNRSDYDVRLVGCDNSAYMENHLESELPAHSYAPRTTDYDQKWKQYDGGNGILDPKYKDLNYIHFNNSDTGDNTVKCYYKVNVNDVGSEHSLYFAVKHHIYTFNTFMKDIGDTAQAKAAHYAYQKNPDLKKTALEVGLPALAIAQTPWVLYNKKYQVTLNGVDALDEKVFSIMNNNAKRFTSLFTELKLRYQRDPISVTRDVDMDVVRAYLGFPSKEEISNEMLAEALFKNQYLVDNKLGKIVSYQVIPDGEGNFMKVFMLDNGKWLEPKGKTLLQYSDILGGDEKALKSAIVKTAEQKATEAGITDRWIPQALEDTLNLYSSDEISAMAVRSLGRNLEEELPKVKVAAMEEFGANRLTKGTITRGWLSSLRIASVATSVLDVGLLVAPFIADIWVQHSPWGNYATTQTFVSFDQISQAEADSWNKTHDKDHQLKANTKLTPPNPDDKATGGNSPLMHSATLSFDPEVEQGVDRQITVNVSLEALSTPNKRLDYVNLNAPKDDPWLGNIDFDTQKKNPEVWSSVLHMTISNNSVSPSQETQYQGQLVQMEELGLSTLAQDERIEAPTVTVSQLVNSNKQGRLMYSQALNSGGLLKTSKNGLMKVGNLEGVFLNSGQELTMNVALAASSKSANGDGPVYGGGFGVTYIGNDESGLDNNFVPIRSDSLKATFDAQSTAPSYLYSKFSAPFPLPLGQSSQLKLSIGGYNDNKRHMGHLYIADAGSKLRVLPVYVNAHLIREPSSATVDPSGIQYPSTFVIQVQNMGSEDYKQVMVSGEGWPSSKKAIANADGQPMCSNGLKSGGYCEITYDASDLDVGSYRLMLNGLTEKQLASGYNGANDPDDADSQDFTLTVSGGI